MYVNADAVFEGGGVKGIALAGAITALEEEGYKWNRVAGASAGAVAAALLAVGYSGKELGEILGSMNYNKLLDGEGKKKLLITKLVNLIMKKGLYSTDYIATWIEELLRRKGKLFFRDVRKNGEYKLKIIVSDISKRRLLVIPDDLKLYGIDADSFEISKAVSMSISIPFFFQPGILGEGEDKSLTVDGGLLSNFPVWIFDVKGKPRWPTFGFRLSEEEKSLNSPWKIDIVSYAIDIVNTMIDKNEEIYLRDKDAVRTMDIPTLGVKTTQFDITKELANKLYSSGYSTAKAFIGSWDFKEYISRYRT